MRCVSTSPPRLAPIFRTDTQLWILAATYAEPDRQFGVSDLAARLRRPQPTVAREVDRLVEAGLLDTELRAGRRAVWARTTSPIFPELQALLFKTAGPQALLEKKLAGVTGVEEAFIYGSWARRYHGDPGAVPNDIDVMIVGDDVDIADVRSRADAASDRLGRDVNITFLSHSEWVARDSGFLHQVRENDRVELDLAGWGSR